MWMKIVFSQFPIILWYVSNKYIYVWLFVFLAQCTRYVLFFCKLLFFIEKSSFCFMYEAFLFFTAYKKFTVRTVSSQTSKFYVKSFFCFMYEALLYFYRVYKISKLCSAYAYKSFFGLFFFGLSIWSSQYIRFLSKFWYFM